MQHGDDFLIKSSRGHPFLQPVQLTLRWDIEIELGETIEDSPFAKVLCGNIRGVVMILDSDVLPLTRPLDWSSTPCSRVVWSTASQTYLCRNLF